MYIICWYSSTARSSAVVFINVLGIDSGVSCEDRATGESVGSTRGLSGNAKGSGALSSASGSLSGIPRFASGCRHPRPANGGPGHRWARVRFWIIQGMGLWPRSRIRTSPVVRLDSWGLSGRRVPGGCIPRMTLSATTLENPDSSRSSRYKN